MYFNNLKKLRNERELSQRALSELLHLNRNNYKNWELGIIMIPLEVADKLSLFYNVRLSYVLGIDTIYNDKNKIKKMDYNKMLKKLNDFKNVHKISYEAVANYIKCAKSTCYNYFKGKTKIPIDRLILLANFCDMDLDKLCGKE